jgi:hypothetical protein
MKLTDSGVHPYIVRLAKHLAGRPTSLAENLDALACAHFVREGNLERAREIARDRLGVVLTE